MHIFIQLLSARFNCLLRFTKSLFLSHCVTLLYDDDQMLVLVPGP